MNANGLTPGYNLAKFTRGIMEGKYYVRPSNF